MFSMIYWVVVSKIFYFHPYLGKIPILTNIFQMGWNHQPVYDVEWCYGFVRFSGAISLEILYVVVFVALTPG